MGRRTTWIVAFASVLVATAGLAAGCALDDSAITSVGPGSDGSVFDGGGPTEASTNDGSTCTAKTCANYPSDCHPSLSDGCGKTIDCSGACPGGQACIGDAGPDAAAFFCNGPPVCVDAGAPGGNCNTLTNPGTGQTTNCGTCTTAGDTCTSNVCVCGGTVCGSLCCTAGSGDPNCNSTNNTCCTKTSTCPSGNCSAAVNDNCGGTFNCRNSCGGQVCDTSTNMCCTVTTTCGTNCNTNITTNCGTSLPCGACSNNYTCNGSHQCTCTSGKTCGSNCCTNSTDVCFPSTTCCPPETMSTTCGGGCGNPVPNNCGQNVDCGGCSDGQVCKAPGGCTCTGTNGNNNTCNQGQTCHTNGNGSCS